MGVGRGSLFLGKTLVLNIFFSHWLERVLPVWIRLVLHIEGGQEQSSYSPVLT